MVMSRVCSRQLLCSLHCRNSPIQLLNQLIRSQMNNSQNLNAFNMSSNRSISQWNKSDQRRVLSIQSHVVHGYVGNKSATFPLQVLGFEVDAINSVQFSNHTGYEHIKGQILSDKELADVFDGLQQNSLLPLYSHLLTGYIGKDSFLKQVVEIVKKLRESNPAVVYVCDPVMGDNGHMYVPENLLPIYRDSIIPLADICTPNQFEVELLTGKQIKSETDAWLAMKWFHDRGVKIVALSSTDLGPPGQLLAFVSEIKSDERLKYKIAIPQQGNGLAFTGTGDLFASLFLAHISMSRDSGEAFEKTTASLQSVIKNTINAIPIEIFKSGKIKSRDRELKLIQSKNELENPSIILEAVRDIEKL